MSKQVFTLTDEDLAKVIAISVKGFGESMGIQLPDIMVAKIKDSTVKAINLFEEEEKEEDETFIQEFVRIYDEDIVKA